MMLIAEDRSLLKRMNVRASGPKLIDEITFSKSVYNGLVISAQNGTESCRSYRNDLGKSSRASRAVFTLPITDVRRMDLDEFSGVC